MKKLLMILAVALYAVAAAAQETPQEIKLTKQQKKKIEAYRDSLNYVRALNAITSRSFVVEADQLVLPNGRPAYVSSTTNFVSLDADEAVVQVAPFNAAAGINGVGGITLDGTVSNVVADTDKKGNTRFSMNVSGAGISAVVDIHLYKGGNTVQVNINPNFNSNRVILRGVLVPFKDSNVFKGRSF